METNISALTQELFTPLRTLPIIICYKCQYAVRLSQVVAHLTSSAHKISAGKAAQIHEALPTIWPQLLATFSSDLIPPRPPRFEHLPFYHDGILCQFIPTCHYVCRPTKVMKEHWRTHHQWFAQDSLQPSHRTNAAPSTSQLLQRHTQVVTCQRLYRQGPGSHYFAVANPEESDSDESEPVRTTIDQLFDQLEEQHQGVFQPSDRTVETLELNEATPWLRRTRWSQYLANQHPEILHSLIETPEAHSPDPLWKIHQAMISMSCTAQMIAKHCGHLIRIEIVRTEIDQSPHTPLQAYMDMETISAHLRPWQQIISFFARTQYPAELSHPAYPHYRFNHRQRKAWQHLWSLATRSPSPDPYESDEDRTTPADPVKPSPFHFQPLERACLDFCIELLNQRIGADEYECALVCALAVLGRSRTGWHTADSFPPILSKIIKLSRFFVLGQALWLDPHAEHIVQHFRGERTSTDFDLDSPLDDPEYQCSYEDEGYQSPSSPAIPSSPNSSSPAPLPFSQHLHSRTGKTFQEWVQLIMKSFMIRGTNSPFQWILDLRTYGMKVSFSTTQPGHIGWVGPDRLLYKQLSFTTGELRSWVHGLVHTIQNLLSSDLLLLSTTTDIPPVPWASLADDPSEGKPGWSFLQDSRTKWPVRGDQWLINRLRSDQTLQQRFLDLDYRCFRTNAIKRSLAQVTLFREKLAILIHLCGGQPARAPELLSVRHRNTANAHRNIFIEDGQVVLATRYHKGFYINNDPKIIHRYLPRTIGTLLIHYLWLVLPLVERFDALVSPADDRPTTARTALLWGPDPLSQRPWTPDRLREVMQRESRLGLYGQIINIASWRHIAIALSRRFLRTSSAFPQNMNDDGETDEAVDPETYPEENFLDLQAGHSSHVAGIAYARQLHDAPGTMAFRRTMFRNISQDWHHFLGFPRTDVSMAPEHLRKKRKYAPWENEQQESQLTRRYEFANCNLEAALQHFLGDPAVRFKEKQLEVLQAIQHGFSPIVAVMPTGGGKSLLFQLPAWISKGLTVVVVPLIALRKELQKRCTSLGISCTEWESHHPPDEASIVLVTPESALTGIFRTFLNRQVTLHRLDRIVIDECHTVLNRSDTFRPELAQIGRLQQISVQTVFLTATLPPSLHDIFWRRLHSSRDDAFLCHSRTTRPNIAYRSFRPAISRSYQGFEQWIQDPQISRFIQSRRRHAASGRVLVYASLVRHVTLLASLLGCEAFYSKVVIDAAGEPQQQVDQEGILARFRRTDHAILVATSALGMGMDIPDIRTVVYIGWPYSLLDYAQETGRAGRDGQPSEAVLIQPQTMSKPPPWVYSEKTPLDEATIVQQWLTTDQPPCRRVLLDSYLDGQERTSCQDRTVPEPAAEIPCEVCAAGDPYEAFTPGSISPPSLLNPASPPVFDAPVPDSDDDHHMSGSSPVSNIPAEIDLPSQLSRPCALIDIDEGYSPVYHASSTPEYACQLPLAPSPTQSPCLGSSTAEALSPPAPPRTIPVAGRHLLRQQDISRTMQTNQIYQDRYAHTIAEENLRQELIRWNLRCWVCMINQQPDEHELLYCTSPQSTGAQAWYSEWRRRIRFAPFSCCFECGLPETICDRRTSQRPCAYPYVLLPMMAMMMYGIATCSEIQGQIQSILQTWSRELGPDIDSEGELVQYLSQMADTPLKQSRFCEAFLYLRQQFGRVNL